MANVKLLVDIEANSAKLVSEVQKSRAALSSIADSARAAQTYLSVISSASIVQLGEKAYQVGQQIYNFAHNIGDASAEIQKNSKIVDMSIADYQKWNYAVKIADVGTEDFIAAFRFLTMAIGQAEQGTGKGAIAFKALGISIKDSNGHVKDEQTILFEVVDALGKYADGTNKDILMLDIFGRSYVKFKPIIQEGTAALKEHMDQAKQTGVVIGDDLVQQGVKVHQEFVKLEAQINATKLSLAPMALSFITALSQILKGITDFNSNPEVKKWWTPISPSFKMPATEEMKAWAATAELYEKTWGIEGQTQTKKPEAPSTVDTTKIEKERLTLTKELLSIGLQILPTKLRELEIEAQLKINEVSKTEEGKANLGLIRQIFDAKKALLTYEDNLLKTAEQYRIEETYFIDDLKTEYDIKQKMRDIQLDIDKGKADADLAYAHELGDLNLIVEAENREWELKKLTFKGSQDEMDILEKTLKLKQDIRQIESTASKQTTVFNLEKQYLELLSQHSNNVKDLISNTKDLEGVETKRLENMIKLGLDADGSYQMQLDLIKKIGEETRAQLANKEITDTVTDVAKSISSSWSSGLMDMINGTKSFAEGMKSIFTDMGNIIIKKLLEIGMNYALMGNISGNKITGGAFGGIGKIISGIFGGGGSVPASGYGDAGIGGMIGIGSSLAEGGITRALLAHFPINTYASGGIAKSPQIGIFGEAGQEAFVPLKGGKIPVEGGRGDTYVTNTYIQATDVNSFRRLYGSTIEGINYNGKRFNKVSQR